MQELFHIFGLKKKEIQTFLRLLELGAQPVSIIARQVGIPRPTMYLVLGKLKKLGLIDEFEQAGITYAKCIPVKNIPDLLASKQKQIEHTLEMFQEKREELEKLENKLSITPKIRFFEGKNQVMQMYEEVLKEKGFCAIFHPEIVKKLMPEYHYLVAETMREKHLKIQELLIDSKEAKYYQKTYASKNHQIKILPKTLQFASDTIICADKIYMVSYGENQVSATEIWNSSLAESQRTVFSELWKNA
ncbi:hypothetical protein HZA38_00735 [Candidatus Peregrinibacteria bacterium]|nr:hypothetical protein [Candidatus Peregrinibacteria bacterium]